MIKKKNYLHHLKCKYFNLLNYDSFKIKNRNKLKAFKLLQLNI